MSGGSVSGAVTIAWDSWVASSIGSSVSTLMIVDIKTLTRVPLGV